MSLKKTISVVWAKMPGFVHWPARYCSPAEEARLQRKKAKSTKTEQTGVVFLGINHDT
jgi:PWWP domain